MDPSRQLCCALLQAAHGLVLGRLLHKSFMPAVVCWQASVRAEAMDRFVGGFYKSVGLGAEVEVAFAEGCNAVLAAGFKLGPPEAGEKHGGVPCLLVDVETPALKRARAALPDVVIEVMPPLKLDFSAFTSASSYATAEEGPGLPTTSASWHASVVSGVVSGFPPASVGPSPPAASHSPARQTSPARGHWSAAAREPAGRGASASSHPFAPSWSREALPPGSSGADEATACAAAGLASLSAAPPLTSGAWASGTTSGTSSARSSVGGTTVLWEHDATSAAPAGAGNDSGEGGCGAGRQWRGGEARAPAPTKTGRARMLLVGGTSAGAELLPLGGAATVEPRPSTPGARLEFSQSILASGACTRTGWCPVGPVSYQSGALAMAGGLVRGKAVAHAGVVSLWGSPSGPGGAAGVLSWAALPDLPSARSGCALACSQLSGLTACLGGSATAASGGALDDAVMLDGARGWVNLPCLPVPLMGTVATWSDGRLVVAGGCGRNGRFSSRTFALDPRADKAWNPLAALTSARHRACACLEGAESRRWWAAAGEGASTSSEVLDLRFSRGHWAPGPCLIKPRAGASLSFLGSERQLLVSGGDRILGPCVTGSRMSIEAIDIASEDSRVLAHVRMAMPRSCHAALVLEG